MNENNSPEKIEINPKDEVNALENEIDNQIYKIYGITEEEKKVIEENLK